LATPPLAAKELIYGSWFGVTHPVNVHALAPYFERLNEATSGAVAWKLVPGAQLANGPGTPEAVGSGLMDGGITIAPYQPSMLPNTNLIFSHSLPGADALAATGAMNETLMLGCPGCRAEFEANHAVGFGGYSTTPYNFMCRGKPRKVADMAGLKVRGSGGGVNIVAIAGATAVSMPPSDATTALERGTLDCVLGAVSWLKSYGYMDVVETVIDSPMGMGGPPILMYLNRDAWKAMSAEDRAMHVRLAPGLVAGAVIGGQIEIETAVVADAKARGITFVPDSAEWAAIMVERDRQQRAINLENARANGAANPEAVLDFYLAAFEKWKALIAAQGRDTATFQKLLWDEVFSKVDPESL
jgi:TRAP-type C4-dicarboxylate transport system substrate-binding protein